MLATAGLMIRDARVGAPTVSVAVPETEPSVAVILAEPATRAVAKPWLPLAFETCATLMSLDDQVAWVVRSTAEPLLYAPVAVNCWVRPALTVAVAGATVMPVKVASDTATFTVPLLPPKLAVTVV